MYYKLSLKDQSFVHPDCTNRKIGHNQKFKMKFKFINFTFSFFFLSFPLLSESAGVPCTTAVCRRGDPRIRFPFRIETRQPDSCGYRGFSLTCGNANATTITTPFSGPLTVQSIDYKAQQIWINDPDGCLPQRILTLDLAGTPFAGVYSQPFVFFNCSTSDYLRFRPLNPIACLSGENGTVFATSSRRVADRLSTVCRLVKTVTVPVNWPFDEEIASSDLSRDLWLTWRVPRCSRCEARGGRCGLKANSTNHIVCSSHAPSQGLPRNARYAIAVGAGVPGTLCLIGLFCLVFSKIKSCIKRRRFDPTLQLHNSAVSQQPNTITLGLDGPTIESYPTVVLGASKRLPKPDDATCSICLSDYEPKETLKTIPRCQHCFHAECIDEWLRLNATCPVCRNSPEKSPEKEPTVSGDF